MQIIYRLSCKRRGYEVQVAVETPLQLQWEVLDDETSTLSR